ncbi:MAG: cytochrome b/b6 domain-containing protein [Gemmatimonadota bacterium]
MTGTRAAGNPRRRGRRICGPILLAFLLGAAHARAAAPGDADCLACHGEPGLTKVVGGRQVGLAVVDGKKFKASVHGGMFACVDCHDDVKEAPHAAAPAKVSCARCHETAETAYGQSVHAAAIRQGGVVAERVPTCASCHGDPHEILPPDDPASPVNHHNVPRTCGTCHNQKFVMESAGISPTTYINYEESVHGRAVASGDIRAAVCTDCHGSHAILGPGDPRSAIYKFNVPATCGRCHAEIDREFAASIHGQEVRRGNFQAPVCTDCHGIHTIQAPSNPASSVYGQNLARFTCARCHEGVRLAEEFGIPGGRITTYMASYHGLASRLGSTVVANCASCHGAHDILPSDDPRSTINKNNLVKTCGRCHPGATAAFAQVRVHLGAAGATDTGSVIIGWVRRIYIPVILAVIGSMLLHNFLIWRRKAVAIRDRQDRSVVRLTRRQRIQHWCLLASFTVLVVTGFALAYPDSWLGLVFGESVRREGHRAAAILLLAVGAYHAWYVVATGEGRRAFVAMTPTPKDVLDVRDNLRYFLGRAPRKPEFGRFNYAEKAEYWALVWGWILMSATGLIAWFKVTATRFLPGWSVDVALAIHFYEAVLATLAIVVWHLYMVILDPDVYPLNWAFWDGRMSRELYREEHPLDAAEGEEEE